MDYILNFSISVSQQMHAHISVSGLPVGPGKKKKNPTRTQVYETRVPLEKKQSKTMQLLGLNRAFNTFDLEN